MIIDMETDFASLLISKLSKCAVQHTIYASCNQKISFYDKNRSYVYLLQSGLVNVRRCSDDIIVLTMKAPAVLGLTGIFSNVYYHYLSTVTESKVLALNSSDVLEFLTKERLWKETSQILCQAAQFHYHRDEVISGNTVYAVIRNHLEMLWEYSLEEREKISIFPFILERSNVSRSSLNKVLKDLVVGGYITLKRGRLLHLNKLPKSY